MWELDYKESWAPKNWCFWTAVLEKTLESPLDCKEIHQSILKEISPGCSLEGLMLKLKLQYFGHTIQRADSFEKNPDAGKDWGQEEKGTIQDEMVGWHHQLNGHEFELALGVGDGQGSLVCCSPWGRRESDMTEWLNWTDHHHWLNYYYLVLLDCFPLFLHFLTSLIKLILWLKFFHRQKAGWGHGGRGGP